MFFKQFKFFKRFNHFGLRRLILLLAVASALVTLANSFYATYRVQRELLIDNTLEANRVYATKLAAMTDSFFKESLQQLAYSASIISTRMDDSKSLREEADRLRLQTTNFNSVVIADINGTVLATSPDTFQLMGKKLTSPGAQEALSEKQPLISQPFMSAANNFIVMISVPIFTRDGRYKGFVGGSIYLKKTSILNTLLDQHYYRDGSYISVSDENKKVLYHQDIKRVGEIANNTMTVSNKEATSGSEQIVNRESKPMLAGFATVPTSKWEIVVLRPTSVTLKPLDMLMLNVLINTLPLAILTLLLVWLFARLIAQPLWLLARSANKMDAMDVSDDIRNIHSWYFEASQLKQAMLLGIDLLQRKIGKLRSEAHSDPMTELLNRRGLESVLRYWQIGQKSFAVIALDIDRFKRINDTYGHDVGDNVIRYIAELIRTSSRDTDILCRSGGEEFLILLPETHLDVSLSIAERLRQRVEESTIPVVGNITISLGVALWEPGVNNMSIERTFKLADEALYQAKQEGRNRVVSASGNES
ncbi:sensor domain-containing diguanylate cyclase [Pectobacterium sp. A5351]|uniref:sensor domain-containing diguanylate cyclase n=1 Tax=Pectobacterium sp. A5351 TaxID=2914983 RepID=UPI00232B6C59|nr:sensor domain-containing diguanylate cyclase [Pectobacterium sp. A5351]WCG82555.1 sensor domain-containing diguanylate cyclase [Pectobacterium sp. A5351]